MPVSVDHETVFFILAAFNLLFAIGGFFGGFILKAIWAQQKEHSRKIDQIHELHLPSKVDKSDYSDMVKALFAKLDRIEDKIDKKQDKE